MLYVDPPENRLIWMDFPAPERVATLADELQARHPESFMVWNLSGASYPEAAFGGRVVALKFAGHLCPPLLMLVEACVSIHAWLSADPANVVAVHCRTGRGRSAVMLCCLLAWRQSGGLSRALASPGGSGPRSPLDWLSHLAQLRGQDENVLTLPSHRRYLQYFGALLGGARPSGGRHSGCHSFQSSRIAACASSSSSIRRLRARCARSSSSSAAVLGGASARFASVRNRSSARAPGGSVNSRLPSAR